MERWAGARLQTADGAVVSPLSPQQEVQSIFKAKHPMDTEVTKAKVLVLRWTFPGSGRGLAL